MEKKNLTREELYDLVWNEPLIKVAPALGLSDNGLRKICTRMNIPLPKAGHWQKLLFGKKINKPSLPAYSGDNIIEFTCNSKNKKNIAGNSSPLKILQKEIEDTLQPYLKVPEKLSKPDKLIIAARESLNRNDRYTVNGILSCLRGELNIRATKKYIPRALRFMDTFIKLLRIRGYEIRIEDIPTYVYVKNQKFEISLREKTKRESRSDRPFSSDYLPTGLLVFKVDRIFYTKEWMDGKLELENQLSSILAKLEISADELNAEEIIREKERKEREQKNQLKKELAQRQERELNLFKETLNKANRWHKTVNLRNYIESVEKSALASNSLSEELKNWLEWARLKADWYDPLIEAKDELLANVDKDNLTIQDSKEYFHW